MWRPKLSIAGIVIILLVAATTLLLGVLAVVGYSSYRGRQREEFAKKHAVIADQLATSLTLPLWNFDRGEVGKVIESAMQDEDVYGVIARSTGDTPTQFVRTRNDQWTVTAATGNLAARGLRIEKRNIVVAGDTIGEVEVFATSRFLDARLRQTLVAIIGIIGFLDLILVVGLYLLLWRTVLRPLQELERHALAVSDGAGLREDRPHGRYLGELASLHRSIEKMLGMLEARFAELQKSESRYRQLAESLRESEEKFSTAFRASPHPVLISELETGRVIDANEVFLRTYGRTRAETIGRTTLELGVWTEPAERQPIAEALRLHGSLRNLKTRSRTFRGEPITVLLSCELIKLDDRPCILTMVNDITEQERAELALRESEEKFSRAFRSAPDAIAIAELDTGRALEVNEGFERCFGRERAQVLGQNVFELGLWGDPAACQRFHALLRTQVAIRDLETEGVNRRGETITVLLGAERISLGGKACFVAVMHDITDRKRATERERRTREEFTRRLIASQEAERRRIAGELHDSLGQNLLLIKNRAQLALATGAIPPEFRLQLETMQDLAAQAIAEVRQISHELRPYQLDQLGLTRALESMIDGVARQTGFPFTRKLDPVDEVFTPEAATHLYRVVQESISNILRHAHASHARITLERDVRHVRLEIADDGCGFTPGEIAAGPHTDGGFGINNLAERVRILHGTLEIDSAAGRGTRLAVTIPLPEET